MDELTRRLRASNPYAHGTLTEADRLELSSIMANTRTSAPMRSITRRNPHRRALWLSVSAGIAAVMVFAAAMLAPLISPHPAYAVTPTPLTITPTDITVEVLLNAVRDGAAALPDPGDDVTKREAQSEGWYAQLEPISTERPSVVQPQISHLTWSADLSGTLRVTAGTPNTADGSTVDALPPDAIAPGTVLLDQTWAPGEMTPSFPTPPPSTAAAMRDYLATWLAPQTTIYAVDYLASAIGALELWTLGLHERRALIEVLLEGSGVSVAGTTIDRMGRDGLVIEFDPTPEAPNNRQQLIIDPISWQILAYEQTTTIPLDDYGIPAGAVIEYKIWR